MTALVRGRVQGVGFREWTRRTAQPLGLAGSATNLPDGRVEIIAQGPRDACAQLLDAVRSASAPGRVSDVEVTWSEAGDDLEHFRTA